MAICWERAVPLAFHLCCFYFNAVLIGDVPYPFGVSGRMWNSNPDHCLFIYFTHAGLEPGYIVHPLLQASRDG